MRGAIWGDPYTIGGKRGMIPPSEPLESVFSPPAGCCYPNTKVQAHRGLMMPENRGGRWEPRGSPTYGAWPPKGGGPMAPQYIGEGGGSFCSKFTGISWFY